MEIGGNRWKWNLLIRLALGYQDVKRTYSFSVTIVYNGGAFVNSSPTVCYKTLDPFEAVDTIMDKQPKSIKKILTQKELQRVAPWEEFEIAEEISKIKQENAAEQENVRAEEAKKQTSVPRRTDERCIPVYCFFRRHR